MGDWIWEIERGRPLGMSTIRESRRDSLRDEDEWECLSFVEEECFDDLLSRSEYVLDELDLEDFPEERSCGTSRIFKIRPVVGSVVEDCPGS